MICYSSMQLLHLINFSTAVCHAEMNAILNKNSADVRGCTIYVTQFPCEECAKLIIQSGITKIVYNSLGIDEESLKPSLKMFELAKVTHCKYRLVEKLIYILSIYILNWSVILQDFLWTVKVWINQRNICYSYIGWFLWDLNQLTWFSCGLRPVFFFTKYGTIIVYSYCLLSWTSILLSQSVFTYLLRLRPQVP